MPQLSQVTQPRFIALDTDFNQAPLGSFNGRSVQQAQPGAPRAVQAQRSSFGEQVKNFFNRVLDAITPSGVRAEGKFRRGLEAFSGQVGDALGALRGGRGQEMNLLKQLESLGAAAQPLTSRGSDYGNLMQQRLQVNLGKLPDSEVRNLAASLPAMAKALEGQLSADGAANLDHLRYAIAARLMDPALARCTQAIGDKSAFAGAATALLDNAADVARMCGFEENDRSRYTVIKDALSRMITGNFEDRIQDPNEAPGLQSELEGMKALLNQFPSSALHHLHLAGSLFENQGGYDDTKAMATHSVISAVIPERLGTQENAFIEAVDKLLGHSLDAVNDPSGTLHNPQGFAKEVAEAGRALSMMRSHAKTHGLEISGGVDEKLAAVLSHLNELLRPSNLMLGELSTEQLGEFVSALATLGVERPESQLRTEIGVRLDAQRALHDEALDTLVAGINSKDPRATLEAISKHRDAGQAFLDATNFLGKEIEGADDITEFRADAIKQRLSQLSTPQLETLSAAIRSPEMIGLQGGLQDVAYSGKIKKDEMLKTVLGASIAMTEIDLMLNEVLAERGAEPAPLPNGDTGSAAQFTPATIDAIRDLYGIEADTQGNVRILPPRSGSVSEGFMDVYKGVFNTPLSAGEQGYHQLSDGTNTGVSGTFFRDFPRANYAIDNGNGAQSLFPRDGWGNLDVATQEMRMLGGIDQLRDLCDGDAEMVHFVSQYVHQGLLAGVVIGSGTPESPIRLPDGTPGWMSGGEQKTSYTFSRLPNGDIKVQVEHRVDNSDTFQLPTGELRRLRPEQSKCLFSLDVTFTRESREAVLNGPVRFDYSIAEDTSSQ